MTRSGGHSGGRMPIAGPRASRTPGVGRVGGAWWCRSLLCGVVLTGCAGAPPTMTPHAPPSITSSPTSPGETATTAAPEPEGASGDGSTVQGRGSKEPVSTEELIELGDELTVALESGDVEQWLALTTLEGDERQQQRDWFAGVQAVPMDVREFHPTWLLERDVEGEVHGPLVEFSFRHQVTGVDAVPSVEIYEFTLERVGTDGPYRIVAVSGSDSPDAAYPQLWDLRPIEVVETDHAVLIGEAGSDVEALAEALDLGAAAVLDQFPVDGVERMSVTVVGEALVARVLGESDEGVYAGFAVPVAASAFVEQGDGDDLPDVLPDDSLGARLVIDQDYSEDEWDIFDRPQSGLPLMRHEGLHLAMMLRNPESEGPRWAIEGFAGWFEVIGDEAVRESNRDWTSLSINDETLPDALPPSGYDDFFEDDDAIERNYMDSANVFLYLEETYGAELTIALGEDLQALNMWIDGDAEVDQVIQDHLGTSLEAFEAAYVAWARDTFGS